MYERVSASAESALHVRLGLGAETSRCRYFQGSFRIGSGKGEVRSPLPWLPPEYHTPKRGAYCPYVREKCHSNKYLTMYQHRQIVTKDHLQFLVF